ncbi:MAG: hypothetical protein KBC81_00300 [Candidatus Pacebacteria bacterium]|nr:hypothetical protein [Candidatus Paceibacterota bacterium]
MTSMFDALKAKDKSQVTAVVKAIGVTVSADGTWGATKKEIAERAAAVLKSSQTKKPATLKRWHGIAAMAMPVNSRQRN